MLPTISLLMIFYHAACLLLRHAAFDIFSLLPLRCLAFSLLLFRHATPCCCLYYGWYTLYAMLILPRHIVPFVAGTSPYAMIFTLIAPMPHYCHTA